MQKDAYALLLKQVAALISDESDVIANSANIASALYHNLDNVNWVGFYFAKHNELVLGPFNGQPACTRIPLGKGVCGTAFVAQKTYVVDDVHKFAGHIACDSASKSEIVVPFKVGQTAGVLDVDSPVLARFGRSEQSFFEAVAAMLQDQCIA